MELSASDYKRLQKFKTDLTKYSELSNSVYSIINGHEYVSGDELKRRRANESRLREKLTLEFGSLEDTIFRLIEGTPTITLFGQTYDVFDSALSDNFQSPLKGQCLGHAIQCATKALGKAKPAAVKQAATGKISKAFSDITIKKVSDQKVKQLLLEFNNVYPENPNAAGLLMRTILLMTLKAKLGTKAKDDLAPVIAQAISQNTYNDNHIKRILTSFQQIPKTVLDATHHSSWILLDQNNIDSWLPGVKLIVETTYK
jgi:hypothetical protein